jgi:two-component system sensor histidine kinase VicK
LQYQELRHLDGIIGYLSVLDGRLVTSTAYGEERKMLPHLVTSTVRILVDQHRYFFETLWNKAIPAKQRIREIEEGAKREFVEIIRDPSEIQRVGFDLIKKAEEEILILFSTPNAFFLQEKAGGAALDLLKEAAAISSPLRNVKVRILITAAENANTHGMTDVATKTNERTIQQLKESGIDVRIITQQRQEYFLQNNNLTLIIADKSSYLTVELKNDTKEETLEEDAIELASYSNSDATVFAYISIFENLWTQS